MSGPNKSPGELETRDGAKDSTTTPSILHLNSAEAQRARLLQRLRAGAVSTLEARKGLDILMPAARVHELRHRCGHDIQTVWIKQATDCGKLHRVALYSLRPETVAAKVDAHG